MARPRTITQYMVAHCVVWKFDPNFPRSYEQVAEELSAKFPALDQKPNRSTIMRRIKTFCQGFADNQAAYQSALEML